MSASIAANRCHSPNSAAGTHLGVFQDTYIDRSLDGVMACLDAQLRQDRRHVVVDGPWGDEEAVGDLRVAETRSQQLEHLRLPRGQTGSVGACLTGWRLRDAGTSCL